MKFRPAVIWWPGMGVDSGTVAVDSGANGEFNPLKHTVPVSDADSNIRLLVSNQ
jgi:hypothetical protein